jgi:hypothetical protein
VTHVRRSREVGDREIRVFEDIEHSHIGVAIRDIPMGALNRPSTWTCGERSRRVGVRNIRISGVVQLVHNGIAIRNFQIQSEPSICGTGGNHREPSTLGPIGISGIGVSGISWTQNLSISKSRSLKSREWGQLIKPRRERIAPARGASFSQPGIEKENSGHHKPRNPESQSGPSIYKDRWQGIRRRRSIFHRRIEDSSDKWFMHCEFTIREKPRSVGASCQHSREGQRRSGGQLSA